MPPKRQVQNVVAKRQRAIDQLRQAKRQLRGQMEMDFTVRDLATRSKMTYDHDRANYMMRYHAMIRNAKKSTTSGKDLQNAAKELHKWARYVADSMRIMTRRQIQLSQHTRGPSYVMNQWSGQCAHTRACHQ